MPRRFRAIYPLFLLSGFSGLIYESIWAQYLKLFLGHAARAQTVVLVVFIGGMALGAALCGRYAYRFRNPLLFYAAAEFIIGWFAIAFHDVFVFATDWGYATLLPATCSPEGLCLSSWVLATVLILPQSILLGTTFPLMVSGALRLFPADPGRQIALLYFLNSLGAVFGVLASAFVLIPTIGLPGASMVAGILNVLLATAIYLLIDPRKRKAPPAIAITQPDVRVAAPRLLLAVALFTGFSSFVYEIVWIRMLSLVLGSSTQAFELMLASFILGLALGGAWIRKRIDRLGDTREFLAGVQIVMGVLAILTIPFYSVTFDAMAWIIGSLTRTDSGYVLFNVGSSLIASAVMLPASFMAGMTLPLITLLLFRSGVGEASLGRVYAANTLGSILGVIAAVHFGLPLLGLKGSLIGAAAVDVALGVVLFLRRGATRRFAAWSWAAAGAAAVLVAPFATSIDVMRTSSGVYRYARVKLAPDHKVLYDQAGKTASVAVYEVNHIVAIATNGKPDASINMEAGSAPTPDEYTMVVAGMLPLIYKPDIATAAVIGFGSGLSTSTLLGSPAIRRVDTVEIEPAMIEGARAFLPRVERAFSDPRSHIILDDAKSYFARSRNKYDLILSEPSNPWVSGVASLFTEEFYRRASQSLNDGGLFVQWVQIYEFDSRLLAAIANAMNPTFKDYRVYYTGSDLLFVASKGKMLPQRSTDVFEFPQLKHEIERLGLRNLADFDVRFFATKPFLNTVLFYEAAPSNSDYEPFVDANAPRARFLRESARIVADLKNGPIPVADYFQGPRWSSAEQSPPPGKEPGVAFQALQTVRYLSDALAGRSTTARSDGMLPEIAVGAYLSVFIDCANPTTVSMLWDNMLRLAEDINGGLSPRQLDPFWAATERSRCLNNAPARKQWVALFRAVGNRDAAATQRHATDLLNSKPGSVLEIDYLLTSALTGTIAQGDMAAARKLLAGPMNDLPEARRQTPWFRLLRRLSGIMQTSTANPE